LNEEDGGIWFTKKELEGVLEGIQMGLVKGTDKNEGKSKLSFNRPNITAVARHAVDASTRQRAFIANEKKVLLPNL
jgi:metallopeptidase MepB